MEIWDILLQRNGKIQTILFGQTCLHSATLCWFRQTALLRRLHFEFGKSRSNSATLNDSEALRWIEALTYKYSGIRYWFGNSSNVLLRLVWKYIFKFWIFPILFFLLLRMLKFPNASIKIKIFRKNVNSTDICAENMNFSKKFKLFSDRMCKILKENVGYWSEMKYCASILDSE